MGKALVIKGADFSQVAVDTIEIQVAQPTVNVTVAGLVTINSDFDVYYTTDGTTPTTLSTKYTAPFNVTIPQGSDNVTIKAVAYNVGSYSEVVSVDYDGTLQAPVISISDRGVATITASQDAEHIYYTTDGTTPTTSSAEYTTPITGIVNGQTVKAIATAESGSIVSSVAAETAQGVVEQIMAGKRFKGVTPTELPNGTQDDSGAYVDDQDRFVSPKIYLDANTSATWVYKSATYHVDGMIEFDASGQVINRNNIVGQGTSDGKRAVTLNANTSYVRFTNPMGSTYAGAKVTGTLNGVAHEWEYDGSVE